MSKIGMGELLIILAIAILVLGPDKIPQLGRALGKAVHSVKKYVHEATQDLGDVEELKDIQKDVAGIQTDLKNMGKGLEKSAADDADKVKKDIQAAEQQVKVAVESEPIGSDNQNTPASADGTTQEEKNHG